MLASIQLSILIFAIAFNIILALFVYKNNPKSATNILFGILSVLLSFWILTFYPAINRYFSIDFLFWARMSIFIGAPLMLALFLFVHTMPKNRLTIGKNRLHVLCLLTFSIMLINISPFAFTGVSYTNGEPVISAGTGIMPFAIYTSLLVLLTVSTIYRKMRSSLGREKEQARLIMIGTTTLLISAVLTILIPVVIFNNNTPVPFAPIYVLIFLAITAYAIIHEGLLDVKLIVARTVSFLFANVLLAFVYGSAVYFFLGATPNYFLGTSLYILNLLIISVALLSFEYLEKLMTVLSNKIFFKKDYDPERLLDELTRIMASTIDLDTLTQRMLKRLTDDMNITKGVFVVFDNHKISDIKGVGYSEDKLRLMDLDILFHSELGTTHLMFEEMEESPLKKLFREMDVSLAFPVSVDGKDIALLLLGNKLSGDVYFDRDAQFLEVFAREAGIAIENSKTYNEIKILNKELEQRVEARTKDLKESQERELEKAKSVAKLKDEFVFVAAHELRAPITAIRGFLELASSDNKKIPKGMAENLEQVHYASDHLNHLVNDLLEVARSEADAMEIKIAPVDIYSLVRDIIKELSPTAKKSKVKLQCDIKASCVALADADKIKEVLVNLISNAIKYNREGGSVFVQSVFIPETDRVFIEVMDTGYGIPQAEQDKIFGKFFRASSANNSQILGTGLGLFITKMLVQKMGGDITFTSVPEAGTTFSFYLKKA
ncbi:MAG: ATP-binding protein [bacterium]|nr:ATP-binding protein [bacterium]